jgi:beta-N-acetylhexosaminidase
MGKRARLAGLIAVVVIGASVATALALSGSKRSVKPTATTAAQHAAATVQSATSAASAPASPHSGGVSPTSKPPSPGGGVPLPTSTVKLLGQRIMVGVSGTSADPGLLQSVREGRVGSVILFAANIVSDSQVRALTGSLQRAARQGHNPPLLIATDQEGGQVKRFPSGPPGLSPPQIAATHDPRVAYREGRDTGRYLISRGVNWDLAPVSDVPTWRGAFIWQQGRAFSFNPHAVANMATQFALGLQSARVAATAKHFPGDGTASVDTDNKLDELHPTSLQRRQALFPYRSMIPRGLDSIMVTTAGFPAYDPSGAPAALSSRIIRGLLRSQLQFGGVAITDALGTPTGHDEITAGVLAASAGADVLLYTDSAPGELDALRTALRGGRISRAQADASYQRIVALKQKIGG